MSSLKGISITVFLCTLSFCVQAQKEFKYTIKGRISDPPCNGTTVYLGKDAIYGENRHRDSTKIRRGKFKFRGKRCEWPHMYFVSLADKRWVNVILEAGKINVEFEKDAKKTSGTPANDLFYEDYIKRSHLLWSATEASNRKKQEAQERGEWTTKDEAEHRRNLPSQEIDDLRAGKLHFIKTYAHYPVIESFVYEMMVSPVPNKELPGILSRLPEESKKRLDGNVEKFRQRLAEYMKERKKENIRDFAPDSAEVGKPFLNVRGITVQGDTMAIDTFMKNKKLYLLDFWASWCGPCMKAMPDMNELYKEYREKGLEIIGLSSDIQSKAWTKALENNSMPWLQLRIFKEKGKDALEEYGIFFIPYTILIDAKGRIVARNLKGTELAEKVAGILD